jgi:hypothetical protein
MGNVPAAPSRKRQHRGVVLAVTDFPLYARMTLADKILFRVSDKILPLSIQSESVGAIGIVWLERGSRIEEDHWRDPRQKRLVVVWFGLVLCGTAADRSLGGQAHHVLEAPRRARPRVPRDPEGTSPALQLARCAREAWFQVRRRRGRSLLRPQHAHRLSQR